MTPAHDEDPPIPAAMRPQWDELARTVRERQDALDRAAQLTKRCRELTVELLRGGLQRSLLIGRPFSAAWLSRIQQDEGLTRRARKATATRP
jgi:hypothetical protein